MYKNKFTNKEFNFLNSANSEDPNEMQHGAAFQQSLHCLLRLKQPAGTEKHDNLDKHNYDPTPLSAQWALPYFLHQYA